MRVLQSSVRNHLLRRLKGSDYKLLEPHLTEVALPTGFLISNKKQAVPYVYFIERGMVSIVSSRANGKEIEIGIVGREGVTGVPALLGVEDAFCRSNMQTGGAAYRISTAALAECLRLSEGLRGVTNKYIHTYIVQVSQTLLSGSLNSVEERAARWLLMCQDRGDGARLVMTHSTLSMMLGVRRVSVTLSLQNLEGKGLIRARRGVIEIINRANLIKLAGDSYGEPEREYQRVLGAAA